jgi:glycosyltransferase involved in cell wall biosynthesis
MVFKVPVLSKLIFAPFKCLANKAYKNADEVVAVSQTYVDRALSVNKKGAKGCFVFLGTNLETFDENVRNNPFSKSNGPEIRMAYCGTLGSSYDLTCAFDALAILKKNGLTNIKFIVMGDGPLRSSFEKYAHDLNINIEFTGRLPYPEMCGRLCSCDIAINPIMPGAAQSIINKHADYAAAGIPVINTQESKEYRELVDAYEMGVNCKNGDAENLAKAIERLVLLDDLRKQMGEQARKCAEEKFNRVYAYQTLVKLVELE